MCRYGQAPSHILRVFYSVQTGITTATSPDLDIAALCWSLWAGSKKFQMHTLVSTSGRRSQNSESLSAICVTYNTLRTALHHGLCCMYISLLWFQAPYHIAWRSLIPRDICSNQARSEDFSLWCCTSPGECHITCRLLLAHVA